MGIERTPEARGNLERLTCTQCKGERTISDGKGGHKNCPTCGGTGKMPKG